MKISYIVELRHSDDRVGYIGHTCGLREEIWTMQQVDDVALAWLFESHAEASAGATQYVERWDAKSREYVLPSTLRVRILVIRR